MNVMMRKPDWTSDCSTVRLYRGDCLEILPTLGPVDAVVTDPPYFKVKGEAWDRQWDKPGQFLEWLGLLCEQWHNLLKLNGSLYCFASPQMAARVEVEVSTRFNVLNRIVWAKNDGTKNGGGTWSRQNKESLRTFFPQTEYVIFAEHYNADSIAKGEAGYQAKCDELRGFVFEPLRAYLDGERERAGFTTEQCNAACGHREKGGMAGRHYFSPSQWCLPTRKNYEALRAAFGPGFLRREYEDLRREYEDLRREYEDLRREYEDLRRPFSVTADVPYTDVWTFPTVQSYPGKHPCEKPLEMMLHIATVSTRGESTILDPFMGSGTTGVAAVRLGRKFVGIELDEDYFDIAVNRIAKELGRDYRTAGCCVQKQLFAAT